MKIPRSEANNVDRFGIISMKHALFFMPEGKKYVQQSILF